MRHEPLDWRGVRARLWAVAVKEFLQIRRDRLTFAMILGVPFLQLLLFGYAINTDPKHLPTAIVVEDAGPMPRAAVQGILGTQYFESASRMIGAEADRRLATGDVQFVITIPEDFSHNVVRGRPASVLVEADATDPSATGGALASLDRAVSDAIDRERVGPLAKARTIAPIEVIVHRKYNPEGVSQYHIVPGLLGVILTMTMVLMTSLAITRERERGTLENLLATPVRPAEVLTGKMIPYVVIGLLQVSLILAAARWLFEVPMLGSYAQLYGTVVVFIAANLSLGLAFSVLARNQLQAMQMTFFYFLPSILLSGFMFPFRGMPRWAQWCGEALPLTHFLRLVRASMLKGTAPLQLPIDLVAIVAFAAFSLVLATSHYKRTLD